MTNEDSDASNQVHQQSLPEAPARHRWRKWLFITLAVLVGLPLLVFGVRTWISLTYTYSKGDRSGYVQKFSHKGWICKTWEGELSMVTLPGVAPEKWLFTVRNDTVATAIQEFMGHKVTLTYEEHRGVPTSCFGDTRYFVIGVRSVPDR